MLSAPSFAELRIFIISRDISVEHILCIEESNQRGGEQTDCKESHIFVGLVSIDFKFGYDLVSPRLTTRKL